MPGAKPPREESPSTGWRETAEAMDVEAGLPEYIDENEEKLEEIAEENLPISPIIKTLLTRRKRGEI